VNVGTTSERGHVPSRGFNKTIESLCSRNVSAISFAKRDTSLDFLKVFSPLPSIRSSILIRVSSMMMMMTVTVTMTMTVVVMTVTVTVIIVTKSVNMTVVMEI